MRTAAYLAGLDDFDTGDEAKAHAAGDDLTFREVVSRVLGHPVLRVLAFAEFCTGIVRQGLLLYYGRFLAQVHGVTEAGTPVRYQIASAGITVGGILIEGSGNTVVPRRSSAAKSIRWACC